MSNLKLPLLQQEKEERRNSSWLFVPIIFIVTIVVVAYIEQLHYEIDQLKAQIKLQNVAEQERLYNRSLKLLEYRKFFVCLTRCSW